MSQVLSLPVVKRVARYSCRNVIMKNLSILIKGEGHFASFLFLTQNHEYMKRQSTPSINVTWAINLTLERTFLPWVKSFFVYKLLFYIYLK